MDGRVVIQYNFKQVLEKQLIMFTDRKIYTYDNLQVRPWVYKTGFKGLPEKKEKLDAIQIGFFML